MKRCWQNCSRNPDTAKRPLPVHGCRRAEGVFACAFIAGYRSGPVHNTRASVHGKFGRPVRQSAGTRFWKESAVPRRIKPGILAAVPGWRHGCHICCRPGSGSRCWPDAPDLVGAPGDKFYFEQRQPPADGDRLIFCRDRLCIGRRSAGSIQYPHQAARGILAQVSVQSCLRRLGASESYAEIVFAQCTASDHFAKKCFGFGVLGQQQQPAGTVSSRWQRAG